MIAVDTSVWIDVLNDVENQESARCVELIHAGARVALTDVVLTEILQGFRTEEEARLVERHLRAFPVLCLETLDDFSRAGWLYRQARRNGLTIRRTLDCLIASVCIREDVPILHRDTDFDRLASCTPLRLYR